MRFALVFWEKNEKNYPQKPRRGGQRGAAKSGGIRLHSPVRHLRLYLSIFYFQN